MRTACNFETQLIALRANIAGLVDRAVHEQLHPPGHTNNLFASSGATFISVLDQLIAEHRVIAHEGEDGHDEAVMASAKLLAESLDLATTAFFHEDGSSGDEPGHSHDDESAGPSGPTIVED